MIDPLGTRGGKKMLYLYPHPVRIKAYIWFLKIRPRGESGPRSSTRTAPSFDLDKIDTPFSVYQEGKDELDDDLQDTPRRPSSFANEEEEASCILDSPAMNRLLNEIAQEMEAEEPVQEDPGRTPAEIAKDMILAMPPDPVPKPTRTRLQSRTTQATPSEPRPASRPKRLVTKPTASDVGITGPVTPKQVAASNSSQPRRRMEMRTRPNLPAGGGAVRP